METAPSYLEKKLFETDKPALAWGALVASGVKNQGELDSYQVKIDTLCQDIEPALPVDDDLHRAQALFDWLWTVKPNRYEFQGNFRLMQVIDAQLDPKVEQVGNCLGLTLLYNVLAKKFGLKTKAVYLEQAHGRESHVFSIMDTGQATIDIDNIFPNGFDHKEHLDNPLRVTWDDAGLIADIYHSIGSALHEQNKLEEAVRNYSKAILFNPKYEKAYLNRGIALSLLGREEEAKRDLERQV